MAAITFGPPGVVIVREHERPSRAGCGRSHRESRSKLADRTLVTCLAGCRRRERLALTGVRPLTETRPPDEVGAAYNGMLSGDARYRLVLTTGK
jgi:hypothetical protein